MKYLRAAAGIVLGTTIKYLRAAAGIGLGTTIEYLLGAAGIGLGTTTKNLRAAADIGLATTTKVPSVRLCMGLHGFLAVFLNRCVYRQRKLAPFPLKTAPFLRFIKKLNPVSIKDKELQFKPEKPCLSYSLLR